MFKKILPILFVIFASVFLFSHTVKAVGHCCGKAGSSNPTTSSCYDLSNTILTCAEMGFTPCDVNNDKQGDINQDGTEETYNSDCFVFISPPASVRITDFGKLFSGLVAFMLLIAFIAAFFFLILGGIAWLTSGGDKAAVEAARNKIISALIGLIIVAATWALFQLVGGAIGFNILQGFTIPRLF